MSPLTAPIQHNTGSLPNAIRLKKKEKKKRKCTQIGKEKTKLSLFTDDMTIHKENLKDLIKDAWN